MKQLKILLLTAILFLFTNNAFSFRPYIPSGTIVHINPSIIQGNYEWSNPDFIQTISTCIPEKISGDNNTTNSKPFVFENYVAWKQGNDVYLWQKDHSTVKTTIPDGSSIYDLNDNKILYVHGNKIYLYDVIFSTISQIDISAPIAYLPSYDNNELAYLYDNKTYFLSGSTTKEINDFENDLIFSAPSLHNGKIAWSEMTDNGHYQIFYWNGNNIIQITNTNFDNERPSLYNGKIAWSGRKSGRSQIFYWNGDNITQITDDSTRDNFSPKLYNGKIVWYGFQSGNGEIFYWNGNNIKQLTNDSNYNHESVDIYDGRIAWKQTNINDETSGIYTCMAVISLKPSVSYEPVTDRASTSVTLNGSVNPNGESTKYRFEYGITSKYTSSTPWFVIGDGNSTESVNKTINHLTPNTTYHYRLVAKNSNGQTYGSDQTFKTLPPTPVLPTVTTGDVVSNDPYTLSATINPNGFDTTFYFEYGTDTNYGDNTSVSGAGDGEANVTVTTPLTDLQPETTYHYRIVAKNAAGTIEGDDKTFTTRAESKMNVPAGQHTYTYLPIEDPVLNINPESAKPFAVGNILGGTLNLKVGLKPFNNPVDIYLAISYSGLPGDIFLIDSNGLHKNTIVPWKTNQTDAIDESLFGNINTADLPVGTYTLYTLVVPAGATNMNNSYLWLTSFNITH